MSTKITEDEFKLRLVKCNKQLLGVFKDWKSPIQIKCLNCDSNPYLIKRAIAALNSKYCKLCASSNKQNNIEDFVQKCTELGYTLLTNNVKSFYNYPIDIKCDNCGYTKHLAHASTLLKYPNKKCCNSKLYNKYTKETFEQELKKIGFASISEYKTTKDYIKIKCISCNNVKEYTDAKNALNAYCKLCATGTQQYSVAAVAEICQANSIIFLDDKYKGAHWYHNFKCKNDHYLHKPFHELLRAFKRNNIGCKDCATDKLRININEIKNKYALRGFDFLSDQYKTFTIKYLTRCHRCKYEWKTSPTCILHLESGCPKCNLHLNEKLTGKYLQELLPDNINIEHHFCLKYPFIVNEEVIRNRLYIDYVFTINQQTFYVEYNGIQHYKPCNFGQNSTHNIKETFRKQQLRDKCLRNYCKSNNIELIEINGSIYTKGNIKVYLQKQLNCHLPN